MKFFRPAEFRHFDQMDPVFLDYLDVIRGAVGLPFRVTSDFRPPDENADAGGSPTSLHLLGRAVDFVVEPWTPEVLWRVAHAVHTYNVQSTELELVQGPTDRHIHLGLFADSRPSRLVLALT